MPTVSFSKDYPSIEIDEQTSLMQALLKAGMPVASSCQGKGICGKCHVIVTNGRQNLSKEHELETAKKSGNAIPIENRLSCQARVHGPITIDTLYW